MALVKRVYADGNTVITAQNLNDIQDEIIAQGGSIGNEYDDTADYAVGDYCVHGGNLYVCNTPITGGEDWDATHWDEVNIGDTLESLNKTADFSRTLTRPNLLDNWYFIGGGSQQGGGQFPINQRGQASYTSSGYCIDRWRTSNSAVSVTVQSGRIDIANSNATTRYTFEQYLNSPSALRGKTVVGSILFSDGTLKSGNGSISATVPGSNTNVNLFNFGTNCTYRIEVRSDGDIKAILLIGASETVSISAIKLEIGSTQTIAHEENGTWVLNELPNYEEQLIRCKSSTADSSDTYANNVISYNAPNPNLLDNWYFVGGGSQQGGGQFPINQRGQTVYTGTVYGIDRWKGTNANANVSIANSGYLRFYGTSGNNVWLQCWSDNKAIYGKTITISMLLNNGTLLTASGTLTTSAVSVNTGFTTTAVGGINFGIYKTSSGNWFAQIGNVQNGGSVVNADVVAAKVEIGSTQTLAHQENGTWVLNEIPNYQQELAKCQRYCFAINASQNAEIGLAFAGSVSNLTFDIQNPVDMPDTNFTITASSNSAVVVSQTSFSNGITSTGFSANNRTTRTSSIQIQVTANSLTISSVYKVYLKNGESLLFSRDL